MSHVPIEKLRRDVRAYEAAHFIADLIGEAQMVLNVGPSWGRDYFMLSERGKWVVNLDIAPQRDLPNLIIGDAARGFPLQSRLFDAILLPEVLEHLIEDWAALQEARRVLKDDGRLVVTVPFHADKAPYHVRIHSDKSIDRLLRASGFVSQHIIYRWGWIRLPRVAHLIRKVLSLLGLDEAWYRFVLAFDRWLGTKKIVRGLAIGAYILAQKGEPLDWRALNREHFRNS